MADKIEIWNMAVSHLGNTNFIQGLDEKSKQADLCRFWYDSCRREMIKRIQPNWSRRRAVLAPQSDPVTGWDFKFAYPEKCLQISMVFPKGCDMPSRRNVQKLLLDYPFEVTTEAGSGGKNVSTNIPDTECIYIFDITDTQVFDDLFTLRSSQCQAN